MATPGGACPAVALAWVNDMASMDRPRARLLPATLHHGHRTARIMITIMIGLQCNDLLWPPGSFLHVLRGPVVGLRMRAKK